MKAACHFRCPERKENQLKHNYFKRLLSLLLAVATLTGILAVPASAASLNNSGTVTIQQAGYGS